MPTVFQRFNDESAYLLALKLKTCETTTQSGTITTDTFPKEIPLLCAFSPPQLPTTTLQPFNNIICRLASTIVQYVLIYMAADCILQESWLCSECC